MKNDGPIEAIRRAGSYRPALRFSPTILVIAFLNCVPIAANPQIALDPYKNSSVLTHHKIPSDRDTAEHWLLYLTDMEYSALAPELANSWAACHVTDPHEFTDGEVRKLFLNAKRREFRQFELHSLQAKIRHGLARRQARKKAAENQLLKAAEALAEVTQKYRGTEAATTAEAALKETGYVIHKGKVLPRFEAFPPFGIVR